MKFERRTDKLLPRSEYYRRLLRALQFGLAITAFALGLGALGYCYFGHLSFVDGLLNASMILFSEGPVDRMDTAGGKLFATFYALFSGVAYISIVAVIFAPVFHRFLHRFHLDVSEEEQEEEDIEEDQGEAPRKSARKPSRRQQRPKK
jgi:hypothetical protein